MEKKIIKNLSTDYRSTVYQAIKKLNISGLAFLALKKNFKKDHQIRKQDIF